MEIGFSKDNLNDLMNTRWLELQDRLLEKAQVRGTRFEDDVVLAFERASVTECNQVRDDVYGRVVQKRYEEVVRRIQDPSVGAHNTKMTAAEYRAKCDQEFDKGMGQWTVSAAMRRSFTAFVSTCVNALHWEGTFLPAEPDTTPTLQRAKQKAVEEVEQRRRSFDSGSGGKERGAGGFSVAYNEGAPAKPRAKSRAKAAKGMAAKASAFAVDEGMDVVEEAPARGSKRPASPPTTRTTSAGAGSATKRRKTGLAQSSTTDVHGSSDTDELPDDGSDDGEEEEKKEISPKKRRRMTSPSRVKQGVKAKLAPKEKEKETEAEENALDKAKREATEELSRRAAEYVATKKADSGKDKKKTAAVKAKKPAGRKRKSM